MDKEMKKGSSIFLSILFLAMMLIPSVSAKSVTNAPYRGYEYNDYEESVAAPIGYAPRQVYDSRAMGLQESMMTPSDCYYDGKEFLYILDSGNGRIIQLDQNMKAVKIYDSFYTGDGTEKIIRDAQGFTLDNDGNFYVANTSENEVLHINRDGIIIKTITRPDTALLDTDAVFKADKVAVDRKNKLYVLVENINLGAFMFNADGEFEQFFGSNPVKKTGEVIADYFWNKILTKEQRKGRKKITPTTFSNFDVDGYGFLYTVTSMMETTAQLEAVRRLNYQGDNILNKKLIFGDLEWDRAVPEESKSTTFVDVDIDEDGFINLLDAGRGRVFQYTIDGEMIAAFGSYSDQTGGFSEPVAIETIGSRVYVLDSMKNNLICFEPSRYGADLRAAFLAADKSDDIKALALWKKVLKQNTNSQYPYYGIGMVYDSQGKYAEAMDNFRLAGAQEEYSKAFREYRKIWVNHYYWVILLILAVLIPGGVFIVKKARKKFAETHGTAFSMLETKYTFPLYTAMHPTDGFDQFKSRKIASFRLSFLLMIILFATRTLSFFYTSFSFNDSRPSDYNFSAIFFASAGLLLLFIASNWSVCTLLNGKGSLKEITSVCSYAMLPYIISMLINTLLSNVLTAEEQTFLQLISAVGILWSAIILLLGLQAIHQYSFGKTLLSILLTIIGIVVIVFLFVLFYTLLQQTINFIRSLITELSLR